MSDIEYFFKKKILASFSVVFWILLQLVFVCELAVAENLDPRFVVIAKGSATNETSFAIIADVGGTKARFVLLDPKESRDFSQPWVVQSKDYGSLNDLVYDYLIKNLPSDKLDCLNNAKIVLSLPAFIDRERIFSNDLPQLNGLLFKTIESIAELGFKRKNILIINDVVAASSGIENLLPKDYIVLKGGCKKNGVSAAVIGCGTGFGQALIYQQDKKVFIAHSESGFETIPVLTQEQQKIIEIIQRTSKRALVKKRDILSGPGIVRLFNAVSIYLDKSIIVNIPEEVISFALDTNNSVKSEVAKKTINLFIEFFGMSIANTIMSSLVEEVYIFGGLIQGLQSAGLIDREKFSRTIEFPVRESMQDFLAKASVYLVTLNYPAFSGLRELAIACHVQRINRSLLCEEENTCINVYGD